MVRVVWYVVFVLPGLMWREWVRNVFGPSREELASAHVAMQKRMAESEAAPTDRRLAGALIRSAEVPAGMEEVRRQWRTIGSSGAEIAAVEQHFAERSGRFLRRGSSRRIQLSLRRVVDEQAAEMVVAAAGAERVGDGTRMRERASIDDSSIRAFEWPRREDGEVVETVLVLHTHQGTAVASLSATHPAPTPEWEREMTDLVRVVRSRLR